MTVRDVDMDRTNLLTRVYWPSSLLQMKIQTKVNMTYILWCSFPCDVILRVVSN
jgi:hypothetical protein